MDPDPAIFVIDLQCCSNKKVNTLFKGTITFTPQSDNASTVMFFQIQENFVALDPDPKMYPIRIWSENHGC